MKWIHVKAVFTGNDEQLAEELVTDIFLSLGLKGVVCDVPLPPPVDGFASDALPRSTENAISGYIPDSDTSRNLLSNIKQKSTELLSSGVTVNITTQLVDQEEWADSWKEFFFVTRITDKIVIKPQWREFEAGDDDLIIHIDPGMAFGTGTHPTTAMCIAMIEETLKPGQTFLDVGTGSGILMIAAALLGVSAMAGIDTDEVAVQVAGDNLEKNKVDPQIYHLAQTTLDQYPDKGMGPFDVVVANIIAEIILEIITDIKQWIKPGGTAILSGIITEKKDSIVAKLLENEFTVTEVREEGEWVAICAIFSGKG
ncbi:ribosomal protein L11 methyltransferase [Desulfocicer vacuolatum DSM 3385]|uniref:Ribosomal protein L11 methyltransferase n=1 Tax=Desulfocicer vacuolatum DSM 3385 TaxID=1121400 RepID=A0A1W1YPJ3_9BACT|nr:50S ribosomal protein L11 methyltransferase [Desulfocicer vacuolatum]SMC37731.1 ribosomal protein L11 methyltransferase [Desulfocicer vacuolatum DSM 3385]